MPSRPKGKVEGSLFDRLAVHQQLHDVTLRATDLEKLVHGASHELNNLQQMTDVINTKQLEDVFKRKLIPNIWLMRLQQTKGHLHL